MWHKRSQTTSVNGKFMFVGMLQAPAWVIQPSPSHQNYQSCIKILSLNMHLSCSCPAPFLISLNSKRPLEAASFLPIIIQIKSSVPFSLCSLLYFQTPISVFASNSYARRYSIQIFRLYRQQCKRSTHTHTHRTKHISLPLEPNKQTVAATKMARAA